MVRRSWPPVVATAVGGIPELVEHGRTGLLVPPANAEAMAGAVEALLSVEELRRRLSAGAARAASERFDLDRQAGAYLEWFQEILDDWGDGNGISGGLGMWGGLVVLPQSYRKME